MPERSGEPQEYVPATEVFNHLVGNVLFALETKCAMPASPERDEALREGREQFFERLETFRAQFPDRTEIVGSLREFEVADWTDPDTVRRVQARFYELRPQLG